MKENEQMCELLESLIAEVKGLRKDLSKDQKPTLASIGFINNDEFMNMLNIKRSKAAQLRNSGTIRYTKMGGLIYYKLTDVVDMMNSNFARK